MLLIIGNTGVYHSPAVLFLDGITIVVDSSVAFSWCSGSASIDDINFASEVTSIFDALLYKKP